MHWIHWIQCMDTSLLWMQCDLKFPPWQVVIQGLTGVYSHISKRNVCHHCQQKFMLLHIWSDIAPCDTFLRQPKIVWSDLYMGMDLAKLFYFCFCSHIILSINSVKHILSFECTLFYFCVIDMLRDGHKVNSAQYNGIMAPMSILLEDDLYQRHMHRHGLATSQKHLQQTFF